MTPEDIAKAVKVAVAQLEAEKVAAAEQVATENADAFELGLRSFAKDAGIADEALVTDFLGVAAAVAKAG